jgi:uncharacterized protein YndB with AHSA1/START domain
MAEDSVSATAVINAPAEAVFAVLTDPAKHVALDGTGWIRETAGREPLTAAGQVFRMPMYHPDHPDGNYETANLVQVFDPPRAIGWKTGYDGDDGKLHFGGWTWRYDLTPTATAKTEVTLTYDWSSTSQATRELIGFPPFPPDHLANSLAHLAELVTDHPAVTP